MYGPGCCEPWLGAAHAPRSRPGAPRRAHQYATLGVLAVVLIPCRSAAPRPRPRRRRRRRATPPSAGCASRRPAGWRWSRYRGERARRSAPGVRNPTTRWRARPTSEGLEAPVDLASGERDNVLVVLPFVGVVQRVDGRREPAHQQPMMLPGDKVPRRGGWQGGSDRLVSGTGGGSRGGASTRHRTDRMPPRLSRFSSNSEFDSGS